MKSLPFTCKIAYSVILTAGYVWVAGGAARTATAAYLAAHQEPAAALRARPDLSDLRRQLANSLREGHPDIALTQARLAVHDAPTDPRNWALMGELAYQMNEIAAAERAYRTAAALDAGFEMHYRLANFDIVTGNLHDFWPQITAAIRKAPPASLPSALRVALAVSPGRAHEIASLLAKCPVPTAMAGVGFLAGHGHVIAALALWQDRPCPIWQADVCRPAALDLIDALIEGAGEGGPPSPGRLSAAVSIWNRLTATGALRANPVHVGQIPDAGFDSNARGPVFAWSHSSVVPAEVVKAGGPESSNALRFEFDGTEPDNAVLETIFAPVAAHTAYVLEYSSRSVFPETGGELQLVVRAWEGATLASSTSKLATNWQTEQAPFETPPGCTLLRITIEANRQLGEVRLNQPDELARIRLQPAENR